MALKHTSRACGLAPRSHQHSPSTAASNPQCYSSRSAAPASWHVVPGKSSLLTCGAPARPVSACTAARRAAVPPADQATEAAADADRQPSQPAAKPAAQRQRKPASRHDVDGRSTGDLPPAAAPTATETTRRSREAGGRKQQTAAAGSGAGTDNKYGARSARSRPDSNRRSGQRVDGQGSQPQAPLQEMQPGQVRVLAPAAPGTPLGPPPPPPPMPNARAAVTARGQAQAARQPAEGQRKGRGVAAAGAAVAAAGAAAAATSKASSSSAARGGDNSSTPAAASGAPAGAAAAPRSAAVQASDAQFVEELRVKAQQLGSAALSEVVGTLAQFLSGSIPVPDGGSVSAATGYMPRPQQEDAQPGGQQPGAPATAAAARGGIEQAASHNAQADADDDGDPVSALDVYVPEVEVVNEVVDKLLGVRLPPKAFYGTRARALAKLSIEECKAQCRQWMSVCGKEYAQLFIGKEPRLLVMPPGDLLVGLQAISSALRLEARDSVTWALRNSSLVQTGITQERLVARLQELCELLQVDLYKAQDIARRHTMLLTYGPGDLQARAELLGQLLPVEPARLRSALAQQPQLLSRAPQRVASSLAALAAITQHPLREAVVMLAAQPGLMSAAASSLAQRWERLSHLAARHPPWQSQLAGMAPPQIARCLAVSDAALSRLAFILNYELQHMEAAQDLKRVLTQSTASFRASLVTAAQQAARKTGGDKQALRRARTLKAAVAADGAGAADADAGAGAATGTAAAGLFRAAASSEVAAAAAPPNGGFSKYANLFDANEWAAPAAAASAAAARPGSS